jgi:hypothetical protein
MLDTQWTVHTYGGFKNTFGKKCRSKDSKGREWKNLRRQREHDRKEKPKIKSAPMVQSGGGGGGGNLNLKTKPPK